MTSARLSGKKILYQNFLKEHPSQLSINSSHLNKVGWLHFISIEVTKISDISSVESFTIFFGNQHSQLVLTTFYNLKLPSDVQKYSKTKTFHTVLSYVLQHMYVGYVLTVWRHTRKIFRHQIYICEYVSLSTIGLECSMRESTYHDDVIRWS